VGLVAEVCAGLDQLLHGDDWSRHNHFLSGSTSGMLEPCGISRCGTGMSVHPVWICLARCSRNGGFGLGGRAISAFAGANPASFRRIGDSPCRESRRAATESREPAALHSCSIIKQAKIKTLDTLEHMRNKSTIGTFVEQTSVSHKCSTACEQAFAGSTE
jgi:hypothetical protein